MHGYYAHLWILLDVGSIRCFRNGHIILFQLPNRDVDGGLELGMVMSIWKGVRNPRLITGDSPINSVVAFRAVALEMVNEEKVWNTLDICCIYINMCMYLFIFMYVYRII